MTGSAVDPRTVVAEIEAEVARRRAAGEYDQELLRRLSAEFRVNSQEEPLEALAAIPTHHIAVGTRPPLDRGVLFTKKVLRRFMAWYVQPIAVRQTRFNFAAARDIRALERRLERLETRWQRTPGTPAAPQPDSARTLHAATFLRQRRGTALVAGPPAVEFTAALESAGAAVRQQDEDEAMDLGIPFGDPIAQLTLSEPASLSAVLLPSCVPMLQPGDLVDLLPMIRARLRPGGGVWLDAPDPAAEGAPPQITALHPSFLRWIPAETLVLLAEAAGLRDIEVNHDHGWYILTATNPG